MPDEIFIGSPKFVEEEEKRATPPRLVPEDLLEQKLGNGDDCDGKSDGVNVFVAPVDVINRFTRYAIVRCTVSLYIGYISTHENLRVLNI